MNRKDMAWRDLYADFGFTTVLPRRDVEWVERRIKGRRWQPHDKENEDGSEEEESTQKADSEPAVDVPPTIPEGIPTDSLWALYGPQATAAAPVEFVPADAPIDEASSDEAAPEFPSYPYPWKALAPEIDVWRELLRVYPEVADLFGIFFARGFLTPRGRDPLAVRDVVAAQLRSFASPVPEEIVKGVLEILGITPEVLADAEAAKAMQMLERAMQKIKREILQAKNSRPSFADLFDVVLANRIMAMAHSDMDAGQIQNVLNQKGLQGKITAERILEILRDYGLVKDPEPIPEPWSWAAPLAETLEAAYRDQHLNREAWTKIVEHWQQEKQPLNEKDHHAILAAARRAYSVTGPEALAALTELVFVLNRDYLQKKRGQQSLLAVPLVFENGTDIEKVFVLEVEPSPFAIY